MLPEIKLMYVCMNVGTMYVEIGQYRVYDPTAPAVAWTCRACRGYKRKKNCIRIPTVEICPSPNDLNQSQKCAPQEKLARGPNHYTRHPHRPKQKYFTIN